MKRGMMTTGTKFKPEVLRFTARLFERAGRVLLEIPPVESKKLHEMPKLEGVVNGQPFRSQVDSSGDTGILLLRVNAAMLRGSGARIGEDVDVAVLGPEPDAVPPSDLQVEFDKVPEAVEVWEGLTKLGQHDWIRWIEDAKKPETRARRVTRTVDQLRDGKRRACCVDVNSFMMCRVEEDEREKAFK